MDLGFSNIIKCVQKSAKVLNTHNISTATELNASLVSGGTQARYQHSDKMKYTIKNKEK
jgi:hypothetical protein